jgi:hypothetical protein
MPLTRNEHSMALYITVDGMKLRLTRCPECSGGYIAWTTSPGGGLQRLDHMRPSTFSYARGRKAYTVGPCNSSRCEEVLGRYRSEARLAALRKIVREARYGRWI